jgi:hypothetical protein
VALLHQPLFRGSRQGAEVPAQSTLPGLRLVYRDGKIVITGRASATPPPYAVIAYNHDETLTSDYDSVAWTAMTAPDGGFELPVGDLKPGQFGLRLRVCHVNGAWSNHLFRYRVGPDGVPQLGPMLRQALASDAFAALDRRDADGVRGAAAQLEALAGDDTAQAQGRLLRRLADPPAALAPADVPAATRSVALSDLVFGAAAVGWGLPCRDQAWRDDALRFLTVGGRFYDRGLFAHAPSRYAFDPAGGWSRLVTDYGLQDGHDANLVFIVKGDGRELWRSQPVNDHTPRQAMIAIDGVKRLELLTAPAAESATNAWAVWLAPRLER